MTILSLCDKGQYNPNFVLNGYLFVKFIYNFDLPQTALLELIISFRWCILGQFWIENLTTLLEI